MEHEPGAELSGRQGATASQKSVILRNIDEAISKASGEGKHRFSIRQLYYAVRPYVIESLGSEPKYDYFSRPLTDVFSSTPDLTPYKATPAQIDLNEMNPPGTEAARLSSRLDFSAPDRVNDEVFNDILWRVVKGTPPPGAAVRAPLHALQVSR